MICPIGINDCKKGCENYYACKQWCYAWDIPYKKENGILIVKRFAYRQEWQSTDRNVNGNMNKCPLQHGNYMTVSTLYETEIRREIEKAWQQAGWFAAIDICCDIDDYDPIPF